MPATDPAQLPAWRRATEGEHRWPTALAVATAIALQLVLPDRLVVQPRWALPGVEIALLVALTAVNPLRLTRSHPALRLRGLALVATMTAANTGSAGLLVDRLLHGHAGASAGALVGSGAAIYGTNVIAFGLLFWALDRGGPGARARGERDHSDFLFPQMSTPDLAPPDWEPGFFDDLYVSFTNATAFSPTDTMPLSRWAKLLMLVQSGVALATVALVIARSETPPVTSVSCGCSAASGRSRRHPNGGRPKSPSQRPARLCSCPAQDVVRAARSAGPR